MNSVSWFVYVAQVSESLGRMFMVFGILGLVATAGWAFVPIPYNDINQLDKDDDGYWPLKGPSKLALALCVVSIMLGNLMPNQNTMYAIAASQVGEQIVKSDIASDATKALHSWIKKQIEPEVKK